MSRASEFDRGVTSVVREVSLSLKDRGEEHRQRPAPEGVAPVVESLMHLLPTAASAFDANGELLVAEEAAPICRLLANPPNGAPDLCARDCHALANEALSSGGRSRGTCTAGVPRIAEPIADPASSKAVGVLVAAVGAAPNDEDHWLEVAARYARHPDEVLRAARNAPAFDLPEWEGIERVEVAATVLTRVLAAESDATGPTSIASSPRLARPPRSVSARRQLARLVLDLAHASSEAVDEGSLLRYVCERVKELVGFRGAWAISLGDVPSDELPTPPGLENVARSEDHPARPWSEASRATYHADLSDWPECEALATVGVERVHAAPVWALGELAAMLFFSADPRDETPATIARRSSLLDDLTPIVGAHLARVRLQHEELARQRRLRAVHEAATKPSASLQSGRVLEAIVDACIDALEYGRCAVMLHDEGRGELVGAASRSASGRDRITRVRGPLADFPVAIEAAQAGRPVHVRRDDRRAVPEEPRRLFDVSDFVVAPLIAHGRLLGFLVADHDGDAFEPAEEELDLLGVLAQSASQALALSRAHECVNDLRDVLEATRRFGESAASGMPPAAALLASAESLSGVTTALLCPNDSLPADALRPSETDREAPVRHRLLRREELGASGGRLVPRLCQRVLLVPLPGRDHALLLCLGESSMPPERCAAITALAAIAAAAGVGNSGASSAPGEVTPIPEPYPDAARSPSDDALRVVVVDDDEDGRELLAALVRRWGHDVRVAEDGREALAMLEDGADILISDLVMPGMGGWELARRIGTGERRVPVILLTGWSLDLEADEVRRRGARLLLEKPVPASRLRSELDVIAAERGSIGMRS